MPDDDRQLGLFRGDASDTMIAGAVAVAPKLGKMQARVLDLFIQNPQGLTDFEMVGLYERLYGRCIERSVGTRRHELEMQNILCDSGQRRLNPITHVPNIVWKLQRAIRDESPKHE